MSTRRWLSLSCPTTAGDNLPRGLAWRSTLPHMPVPHHLPTRLHSWRHAWLNTWLTACWSGLCVVALVSCSSGQESTRGFDSGPGMLAQNPADTETIDRLGLEDTDVPLVRSTPPARSTPPRTLAEATSEDGPPSKPQTPSVDDVVPHATETVNTYLQLTDQVGATGGQDLEPMVHIVTPEWLAVEERGFADYRERQIRTLGQTDFFALSVQSVRWSHNNHWEVAVFACIDSRNVWVIPANSPDIPEGLVEWLATLSPATHTAPPVPEFGESDTPVEEPTEAEVSLWQEFIAQTSPDAGPLEPVLVWLVGPEMDALKVDATDTWRGYHPCGTYAGSQ